MWPCPSRNLTLTLWPPLTRGDRDPPSQLERHPEPLALHLVNGTQGALTQKTARSRAHRLAMSGLCAVGQAPMNHHKMGVTISIRHMENSRHDFFFTLSQDFFFSSAKFFDQEIPYKQLDSPPSQESPTTLPPLDLRSQLAELAGAD